MLTIGVHAYLVTVEHLYTFENYLLRLVKLGWCAQ